MTVLASSEQIYLSAVEDNFPMRESGEWVAEKLHYLQRYFQVFSTSMRNKPWRNIRYIDLFAGPGKCLARDTSTIYLGSPLLALTTAHLFTDYIFVDLDASNINTLSTRCAPRANQTNINYRVGDSNQVVHEIAREIAARDDAFIPDRWCSLNLAVLDPEGLELEWSSIEALAKIKKMDLIIHYSQFGLTRNMENMYCAPADTTIDRFFGDRKWREIYAQGRQTDKSSAAIHRQLIDYYKTKLTVLGYKDVRASYEFEPEPIVRNSQRNAPLYRLLFASKNDLGHKFWKDVTKKDSYGQGTLF